jgi:hypothetical protein
MTVSFFHPTSAEPHPGGAGHGTRGVHDDLVAMFGPVMAGARARGVADALDLVGIAAVLIDRSGRVLHCGPRAERALAPFVRVVGHHLLGGDARIDDQVGRFLARIVDGTSCEPAAEEIEAEDGSSRTRLRALRFPATEPEAVQLLHSIVIIEPVEA